jgi:hypothetical protein
MYIHAWMSTERSTAKPINLDKYKNDDDGGRIVTAISVFGVPTYPKKTNADDAQLVHWRVHLRWAGRASTELAKGSVVCKYLNFRTYMRCYLLTLMSSGHI